MPQDTPIVEVSSLSKSFGTFEAVKGLDFSVMAGDVYGFLGQNGAGKSTTIRMLLSLIRPTEGRIRIFGMDLQTHRRDILRQVGAVIESPDLYTYLNGYENLEIFSRLSGIRSDRGRLMQKLEQVGLADRCKDKVRNYSQGMKQRLGIAVAMVHDPGLIVLDEPTNGLDPQGIADIRNLILYLSREQGKTVIVSSHLLSEIEQVATRLLIIDKGRKVAEGPIQSLLDPEQVMLELDTTENERCLRYLNGTSWKDNTSFGPSKKVVVSISRTRVPELARELMQEGFGIRSMNPQNALEGYFLSLTQNPGDVVSRKH
jgi:ABC-type multidrug transport system ATPase subunit